MSKIKSTMSPRGWRAVLVAAVAILGMTLIAGCGPSASGAAAQAHQLEQQYPWLVRLGMSYVEWLIRTYGPNILALLAAALAAL